MKPKRLLAFDALERSLKRASDLVFESEVAAYAPLTEALWWIDYLSESFRVQNAGYVELVSKSEDLYRTGVPRLAGRSGLRRFRTGSATQQSQKQHRHGA